MSNKQINLSKEVVAYTEALLRHGMFVVDNQGRGEFSPLVRDVIKGIHQILAGGDVTLQVAAQGKGDIVTELDAKLTAALASVDPIPGGDDDDVFSP